MVNERYLLAAQNLNERNKNRLSVGYSPKEKEIEELFYWILSRFEWSMQGNWPGSRSYSVTVKESYSIGKNRVLLQHGVVSEYLSQYVGKEEFYTVMKDVEKIFNEIGKQMNGEGSFYASCLAVEGKAELTVAMNTNI